MGKKLLWHGSRSAGSFSSCWKRRNCWRFRRFGWQRKVDDCTWTKHANADPPFLFAQYSYVPRKCSATNRIIKAKDHASVQISIAKVDESGRAITGENHVYALCGFVRAMGESDDALNRLVQRDGLVKNVWSGQR